MAKKSVGPAAWGMGALFVYIVTAAAAAQDRIFERSFRMKRIVLLCLVFLFSLFSVSCSCKDVELIIEKEQLRAYSVEELIEVFTQYREKFERVAEIVLESEEMEQIMHNSGEGVVSIWTQSKSVYFSEEEWSDITELFHLTGLNRIERITTTGKDAIKFIYRHGDFETILFYCETNDDQDLSYFIYPWTKEFQKIDEYWWVGYYADSDIGIALH